METFAEWKERTRKSGLYKIGFSVAFAFIAEMLFVLRDPVDPDLGLGAIAWLLAAVSFGLWFLGFWDYVRSKGLPPVSMLLSLTYLPGLAIAMAMRETWQAFGPDRPLKPSVIEPRVGETPKIRRLDW